MLADRLPGFVLLSLLAVPAGAFGGIYNPCEVDEGPYNPNYFQDNRGFKITLIKYRSCGVDTVFEDSPFRQRYLIMQDLASTDTSKLTVLQKVSLSEYLIRRHKVLEARRLLLSISEPGDNFLIHCNLAMAFHQTAEGKQGADRAADYQQAIDYLSEGLRLWPRDPENRSPAQKTIQSNMYWTPEETYPRCRTAEEHLLKLMRNRLRETRQGTKPTTVDPLFTDKDGQPIRYVNDKGVFAPGTLAAAEKAKLPEGSVDKALTIVCQLLVWLPEDPRLYWQLGELYNARGSANDLVSAKEIFIDLYENIKERAEEVKERRRSLKEYTIPTEPQRQDVETVANTDDPPKREDYKAIDWRTIGVSFGFGLAVALFAQWQIREIRRRRQRA